jgi:hypothetical protein
MKQKAESLRLALALIPVLFAAEASAQQAQQAPITGDIIIRQEWTEDIFTKPDQVPAARTRFQLRPRFEIETNMLRMGLGVDVNYSTDDNTEPDDVPLPLNIIRDNYDSRGIRLDIAYLGINLSSAIKLDAGRMPMPFRTTDMIWDRDLRVQGASVQWTMYPGPGVEPGLKVSGIYSRGSHTFVDSEDPDGSSLGEGASVMGGSLEFGFGSSPRFDFAGTYLDFDDLQYLERMIRRQNTRISGGPPIKDFEVLDLTLRFRVDSPLPIQVVLDGARNLGAELDRDGFWGSIVFGSLRDGRFRGEYTYAHVDKDVTVAAYAGDDFFWGTGWAGHRAEFAFAQSPKATFHVIGNMMQFKDAPNPAERSNWVKRIRLEVRRSF